MGVEREPERRRVEFRTREGLRLAGDAWGEPGRPVALLLHGGGQTRHAWGGTALALARRGWRAITVDFRGHGESDWAPDGSYGMDRFAGDVREVVESLGTPPVLVGASLGGMAGLMLAGGSDPVAFPALVLVDIAPRIEDSGVTRIREFMAGNPEGFETLEEAAAAVAAYVPQRRPPSDLGGLRKNLREGPDGRYRWHWDPAFLKGIHEAGARSFSEKAMEEAARRLRAPTLLVRGNLSDLLSEEGARSFLRLVPHARYVDVSDAGHMVAGDQNDVFSEAVVAFLDPVLQALAPAEANDSGRPCR